MKMSDQMKVIDKINELVREVRKLKNKQRG